VIPVSLPAPAILDPLCVLDANTGIALHEDVIVYGVAGFTVG
jgi:hypothetical protein